MKNIRSLPENSNTTLPFLTAKDVAARWLVHPSYVYALAQTGELPSIRFGRRRGVRFSIEDVQEFEAGCRVRNGDA